jgi:hypothetical protein
MPSLQNLMGSIIGIQLQNITVGTQIRDFLVQHD